MSCTDNTLILVSFLSDHRLDRDLPSFPTRRSSDLGGCLAGAGVFGAADGSAGGLRADGEVGEREEGAVYVAGGEDRKSTRLNSSHVSISYAVFCLKKKTRNHPDAASSRLDTAPRGL